MVKPALVKVKTIQKPGEAVLSNKTGKPGNSPLVCVKITG